ncbi:MAG TPA: response regulator transcription factor [Cyclobacteriaceae bacterium]|nr:response regulator transcription factor [Cyclobacteriaceae bacterium]HRK55588.1 response regulator transcription factor [Cyclobacteriaceae bacterium]
MSRINICIVDDHNLFRKAMVRLLKTFRKVGQVSEAQHGKELLQILNKTKTDVILLDLEMPIMNGVETAEYVIPKYPDIKIIVLTQHDSEKFMLHMLELGVHSFLLKNSNPDELERAILSVYEKDFYHNDLISSVMRKSISMKSEKPLFSKMAELSEREKEIFGLICEEHSLKEISIKLNISEKTIHSHKANIQHKLGVRNTVGMIKFAYENGLLV